MSAGYMLNAYKVKMSFHIKHLAYNRCSTDIDSLPLPVSSLDKFRAIYTTLLSFVLLF